MWKALPDSGHEAERWEGNYAMQEQAVRSAPDVTVTTALRRAAVRAVRAPSVHNSQPWRLTLSPDTLTVRPDPARQLPVFDPTGRQLLISCGCAATNAQVSLAAHGVAANMSVELASGSWPFVRVRVQEGPPDATLAALEPSVETRSTPRGPLERAGLSPALVDLLREAADAAGLEFGVVRDVGNRAVVDRMAVLGTRILCTYPEYLAELRSWTTGPARADGLPPTALPLLDGSPREPGGLSTHGESCDVLWLATPRDDPASWLTTGTVLERLLLELTATGLAAIPLAQVIEVPTQRNAFAAMVGTVAFPQAILRVGRAPAPVLTRRRRLSDVIA